MLLYANNLLLCLQIPSGRLVKSYLGHNRLVYDVDWTRQSDYVVTASADSTARCVSLCFVRELLIHVTYENETE